MDISVYFNWEEPLKQGSKKKREPSIFHAVERAQRRLVDNPGRWAKLAVLKEDKKFKTPTGARLSVHATNARSQFPELDFAVRTLPSGDAALYARFLDN